VSRTWRSEVPRDRAIVYAAVGLEGAILVTFFVAVQLLLNRGYFSLSAVQYGAVFVPVFAAAVLAAIFAVWGSRAVARGHVFLLGLILSAAGRAAMIIAIARAVRHAAIFFPDLVIIGTLTGAGFALVYSAATAFELDIDPGRSERHLLRLGLTLAAGMAIGPLLQIGLIEAGLWWVVPVIFAALTVLLIAVSSRSRLGPDAARSCALLHRGKRVPVRVKLYVPVAFLAVAGVVICVAWSQARMIGRDPDGIGAKAFVLGAFWPALTVLAEAAFSAIEMRASWRRTANLTMVLVPAVVTVTGLATGRAETAVVGIFLLAAVACAAVLPRASQLTEEHLALLPPATAAGIIAIYPVAIALARPSLNGFRSDGVALPMIFGLTATVAVAAFLICADLIVPRRVYPDQSGALGPAQSGSLAATHEATAADRLRMVRPLPPPYARPCTAVDVPRGETARPEDEDQSGAQSAKPGRRSSRPGSALGLSRSDEPNVTAMRFRLAPLASGVTSVALSTIRRSA
jgi:MFS family permease